MCYLHLPEVLVPVDCVGGLPAHLSASCMSRAIAVDNPVPPSRHLPECMGLTALFLLVPTRIIEGLQTTSVMFSSGVWGRSSQPQHLSRNRSPSERPPLFLFPTLDTA